MLSTAQKKRQSPSGETKDAAAKAQTKSKNTATPAYLQRKTNGDEEQVARKQDTTEKAPEEKILDDDGVSQPLVQRKLEVGAADDPMEKEADQVADAVVQNKPVPNISSADQQVSRQTEEAGEQVQAKTDDDSLPAQADDESLQLQRDDTTAQAVQRQSDETEVAQTLRRKTLLQAKGAPQLSDTANEQVEQMRGNGAALPDDVRMELQNKLGGDFSKVSIHNNTQAHDLAAEISARAFTVGEDIFFAAGEYDPQSQEGKRLLSHELTHVVQQSGSAAEQLNRSINPQDTPDDATAQSRLTELSQLSIPPIKQRHLPMYNQLAQSGNLARVANYTRRRTAQSSVWKQALEISESDVETRLSALDPPVVLPTANNNPVNFNVAGRSDPLSFTKRKFLRDIVKVPKWDREGNYIPQYQVDHIVELQTSGAHGRRRAVGNSIENMELLDQPSNGSSGAVIMNGIYSDVDRYLTAANYDGTKAEWLRTHEIVFESVHVGQGGNRTEGGSSWWTLDEIRTLAHLDSIHGAPPQTFEGDTRNFVLASGPGGVEVGRFGHRRGSNEFTPRGRSARSVAGLNISSITLNDSAELDNTGAQTEIGTLTAEWDLPEDWAPNETETIMPIYGLGPYAGYLVPRSTLDADFEHASPATFNELTINSEGLSAVGALTPSIDFLSGLDFSLNLIGDDVVFRAEYTPENLNLSFPGITIDDGSIALSYGRRQGFGVEGTVFLSVNSLGDGSLSAGFNQQNGFYAEGTFNFDSELFDRATASLWYRSGAFGGEGTIGIDSPDKIKGIRSAELTVGFAENSFTAEGSVSPNLPGVEEAGLEVSYSEEEGLTIGGQLSLNEDTPGIQSGEVEVTLQKQEGQWKVNASGTAQPDIPGINSELTISYNDGAFTAEVAADYERGMLSGRLDAGVTNRTVDAETGELSDTAEEGNSLVVYGGGSLTLQLAPWLQGTAGVRFAPNGEITVTGEIGLPDELEIFARREINKSIFNVAIQAPIVPGIVAEVGGGLGAVAGIGPGVIDELRLGVEYNPDREEDTRVTGDAHLNIPADAGLRLSVRAGIGLGITGASATGGLEIGGTLGIEGAAEAGVHVEWTPTQGLDIRANVGIHAQPSFTFDISGYVSVRALGFSVYDETWELASFSFGSDYRFGINLPIHYQEGQPFDISVNDIEFEVPNINTSQLLRSLISRIA